MHRSNNKCRCMYNPVKYTSWLFFMKTVNGYGLSTNFFSINMNYTLNRKYNKYSSSFDIYLTKWGKMDSMKYKII